jgi:hypothetical protein
MTLQSKIVTDINAVQKFSDILNFQITIPPALYFFYIYLIVFIPQTAILIQILFFGSIVGAAILFTPYIFYILIKEKRYGWIITFFIMIIIPLIFGPIIFRDTLAFEASLMIPLGLFYFYCYLIKFSVAKWIRNYNWHKQLEEQRKQSVQKKRDLMTWL